MNEPAPESSVPKNGWIREADLLAADAEPSRALAYLELWTRLGVAPPAGFSAAECAEELAYWNARAQRAKEALLEWVG